MANTTERGDLRDSPTCDMEGKMNETIVSIEHALVILREARIAAYLAGNDTGMLICASAEVHLNGQLKAMIMEGNNEG